MNRGKGKKDLRCDFYIGSDNPNYVRFSINLLSFTVDTIVTSYKSSIICNKDTFT